MATPLMPILNALIAAAAFGLSAPLSKRLLDVVSPLFLAGLLYLGAGLFLGLTRLVWRRRPTAGRPLAPRDRRILAAVVLVGGVLAPPLLLWGLARSLATTTALLLNLEVVFTALLAGLVFGEHLGPRVVIAAAVMALGGIALGWTSGGPEITAAAGAVALACLLWALDNNLTRLIAEADPLLIVEVKGLVAGTVNVVLALASVQSPPSPVTIAFGLALGAVSYGTCLVLFILAMRELGASRAGAYFSTERFFGSAGGLVLLGESPPTGPTRSSERSDVSAVARETEARGYHAAWTGEASGYDAITLMATIASHTERLHVGSAVVSVQTRTPVVLGQSAATLNHLAPGRVVLGIGVSSKVIVGDWHGLSFAPSLQQIREAVQIIRAVASGERVSFEGKFYKVKNFRLTVPPPAKPVRVVLAALGSEMLELAGEIADGVVLNWIPP